MINKYVKLVVLSTLEKPRTAVEIGTMWYNSKGRLYKPSVAKEIKKAVDEGLLTQKDNLLSANIPKVLDAILSDLSIGEETKIIQKYRKQLKYFYTHFGDYVKKVYLSLKAVQALTKSNYRIATEMELRLLFQLPFLLRLIEREGKDVTNIFIQVMNLTDYVKTVEKLEVSNFDILREKKLIDEWVENFEFIPKTLIKLQNKGINIFNTEAMKAIGGQK